jgi:uncharacterized protein YutE (UPF0331/DUF86 family)
VLRRQQGYGYAAFASDPERYGSAERFLQLAIETLVDMGSHVIADEHLGVVNWSRDVPTLLADHGYIDEHLRDRWIEMIGFRNVLVHAYLDVDRQIVYEVLQTGLDDIEALRAVFARFL